MPLGGQSPDTFSISEDGLRDDLTTGKERPQWPLSAYGPGVRAPRQLLEGGVEVSPEEMRALFYLAQASGNPREYVQREEQLMQQINQQIQTILNDLSGAKQYIIDGRDQHPNRNDMTEESTRTFPPQNTSTQAPSTLGTARSGFGTPSSLVTPQSAFGAPSTLGQSTAFGAPSSLGQAPAFGRPAPLGGAAGGFGRPSQLGQPTAFGQATSRPGVNQPPTSGFGVNQQSPSAFGASPQAASGFGTSTQPTSGFSTSQQPASGFGASQPTTAFGQATRSSPFGQPSALGQPSAFAQPTAFTGTSQRPSPFAQATSNQAGGRPFAQSPSNQAPNINAFGNGTQQNPQSQAPSPFVQASQTQQRTGFSAPSSAQLEGYVNPSSRRNLPVVTDQGISYYEVPAPTRQNPANKQRERIWHPNGPPGNANLDAEGPTEAYDGEDGVVLERIYKAVRETGKFTEEGGLMPEIPPKRNWIDWNV